MTITPRDLKKLLDFREQITAKLKLYPVTHPEARYLAGMAAGLAAAERILTDYEYDQDHLAAPQKAVLKRAAAINRFESGERN